jgi:type IX secretion system substrate protein/Big-like domain-containing protein
MNFLKNIFRQKMIYKIILIFILASFSLSAQLTFIVNTVADSGQGSLRNAINSATGNDTIIFSGLTYPDTIRLTTGQINISNVSLVILGPGADSLSISGEHLSRIFTFGEGDAEAHGLSFNNGYVYGFQNGGAFDVSAGALSLYDCIVSNNEAIGDSTTPSSAGLGGAFYVDGQLSLIRTSVYDNRATGGFGNDGYGGAIYQAFGNSIIINSTISGNRVEGGPATVGNNVGIGGAIASQSGNIDITSSTVSFNLAFDGAGGGIFNFPVGTVNINNSIIAQNTSPTDTDVFGTFNSTGFNFISDVGSSLGWLGNDLIGLNPNLGILRNNGGPSPTHALLPGSPAIDVGDTTVMDTIDQRGFPRIQDGNGNDIAVIDIGAYEAVVPVKPINLTAMHGDRLVILDWQYPNDSTITQYNIYRDSSIVGNAPVGTITYTDINLTNGQSYLYYITAVDTIGFESSLSQAASATPNGPPRWSIPQGLFTFDEDDSLTVDLDSLLFDDSDPDDSLTISISSGSFVIISLNQVNHIAQFSAPLNAFGLDSIIFNAFDPEGLTASDTAIVRVNPVNDFPVMSPVPDSTILTYTAFSYQVSVNDLEGDSIRYFDNTNLFNIDSSGLIAFRPTMLDTGNHEIIVFAADNDTIVRDTFLLDIQLSVVNSPLSLNVTPLDQALNFSWTNPANAFYSGTRIVMRKSAPVTHPDSGIVALDTLFTNPGIVSATIPNLDIADRYYFMIFNYFRENTDVILSGFVTGSDSTLSPQVSVDLSPKNYFVLNGAVYDTSIVLTNDGGGTLIGKFNYNPTALQASWFSIDSTVQIVGPFSSINVPMSFTIPTQILDTLLTISTRLETNQPGWLEQTIDIRVNNIFDRFAPQVFIDSEPDSIVMQAAVKYEFTINDTVDSQIGDLPDNLFIRYALYNTNTNQFVRAADSLHTNEIILYPLVDGVYELSLWIYDHSGNGRDINEVAYVDTFAVNASRIILPNRKWLLSSIPRDNSFTFPSTASDSDFVIFRWNAREEEYNQIANRSVEPGLGYWIYSNKSASINVNNIPFETNNDSVIVPIAKGWNQIGMPMPFDVEMSNVRFVQENVSLSSAIPLAQAVADSVIGYAIYWYHVIGNQSGYAWGFIDTTFTQPWRGYWIFSETNGSLIYSKEPSFRNSVVIPSGMISNQADTWQLNLSIDCENLIDSKNIIGTRIGTNIKIQEPPVLDKFVSMYFKSGNNKLTGLYNTPLKDYAEVKNYDVFFETSEINKPHLIKWQLPENNVYFYLVDNNSEKIIDMREETEYSVNPNSKSHGMILYATYNADFKPSIIPVKFKLKQNYPNPFNPITTIEFGIPENGKDNITTLKIFNILGQEITTLIKRKINSGYHKITWSGLNKNNQKVASGLYFYSLSNGKTELFKKMIFIK